MPTYESMCATCGTLHNYIRKVPDRADTPVCCNAQTRKVILTVPMGFVQPDICYDSPIDGTPITNKQKRIEDLKRSGCRPYEGREQEEKEVARTRMYEEQDFDRKLVHTTEKSLMQISEDSRRALLGA